MITMGLGGSSHDFSVCLSRDSEVIVAIEEERLNRQRHAIDSGFQRSLAYCCDIAGIELEDINVLCANDMIDAVHLDWTDQNIIRIGHHEAHAYSAFFTSPFSEAAIFVADGCGSVVKQGKYTHLRETTSYFIGQDSDIRFFGNVVGDRLGGNSSNPVDAITNNSIGDLYEAVTQLLGFQPLQAGKTMGLATYGDDRYFNLFSEFVHLLPNGQFYINLLWENGLIRVLRNLILASSINQKFVIKASIAAACQFATENILTHCLGYLHNVSKMDNLCLSGGVALNCVFNGKVLHHTKFKNVNIFFAPNDSGTAIGAAIYADQYVTKTSKKYHLKPFLGKLYDATDIIDSYKQFSSQLQIQEYDNVCQFAAQKLQQGLTVAWYQGRSEFGPRALGNRSILASTHIPNTKNRINQQIKHRENFRPFAPVILEENVAKLYPRHISSPFMQFNLIPRRGWWDLLREASHIDHSTRLQTLSRSFNPLFYRLLVEYYDLTNVPAILNTSFNSKGEPIVETPLDAISTYINCDIDILVIGNFIVTKHQ